MQSLTARSLALVRSILRILRFNAFGTDTAADRSQERYRRAALSTAASSVAKGIALLTALVSVPLTLTYLGSERFGMWMTLAAMITILAFTNLGVGNSLLNSVAYAAGLRDRALVRTYVSSGLAVTTSVALLLAVGFAATYQWVPWPDLFNVDSLVARQEAGPAAAAFVGCFLLGMPLGALQQVRTGLQQDYVNSVFAAIGNLAALALVIVAIRLEASLPWLVLAMAGTPVLAYAANGVALVSRSPWLRPSLRDVRLPQMRALLRVGLLFLVLQLASALAFASDSLVLAHVIGPSAVAEYTIVARLFSVPLLVTSLLLAPLWPAYREALAAGDTAWLRRTFERSVRVALMVGIPLSTALVVIGVPLTAAWVESSSVRPTFGLVLAFGVWTIVSGVGTAVAMLLNGAQVVGFQVLTALFLAPTSLGLSIALAGSVGVAGVVWASAIAYIVCTLVPTFLYLPKLFARIEAVAAREEAAGAA